MTLALHGKSRQRQLFLILLALLTVGAAIFGATIAQRAAPAEADQDFVSVSFNGGSAPVNVSPGETIAVSLTVNLTQGDNWRCTEYRFGGILSPTTDVDFEPDFTDNGQHTHNFDITAPNDAGSYDFRLRVSDDDDCSGGLFSLRTNVFDEDDAITVEETPPADLIPAPNSNFGGFDQCVAPNIMLVIDNSTSIGASELASMKTAVNQMVGEVETALPGANWAGVHFRSDLSNGAISTPASGWAAGITDITNFVDTAQSDGYTPTASGISAALGQGTGPGSQPALMIIITDGDPNVGLGDPGSAGTSEAAYVNGAIDAVAHANLARTSGWNTLLAFFGPGDTNAQAALGGDYDDYNAAVRNGLAGIPNGYPTGEKISVANASALATAITAALLENCQGAVVINKLLDGQPANGWQFTATVSGGTADPAGPYTTADAGTTSFNVDAEGVATVSITETGIGGTFDSSAYSFESVVCTGSENDGQHTVDTGTRTISGIEVASDSTVTCDFNNATNGDITIEKYVYNPDTGTWDEHTEATPFTFDIDPVDGGTTHSGVGPGTYDVAPGTYIVGEVILDPDYVFVALIDDVAECPSSPITVVEDQQTSQVVGDVEVEVESGDNLLVCAYNEPNEGSITIEKYVFNPDTGTWDEHIEATPFAFDIDPDNGGTTHSGVGPGTHTVVPGFYTVSEVLPVAGYDFVGIFPSEQGSCLDQPPIIDPEGSDLNQEINDIFVEVALGQNVLVCAYNEPSEEVLADVNLFVNKFEADGDNDFSGTTGLGGWTINLECLSGECESGGFPTSLVTDGAGLASFGAVPFGDYEVCEVPQAGYTVVGSLLDGGNSQAGECRTIEVSEESAGDDITIVVDFFNHPEAGIRVEKRQLEDGALDVSDNGGWEITVEGCGESFTQTTNEAIPNSWTFFDVPPCESYVVSEDPDSKPGYTPVSPTSVNVSVGLGENALVTFVNDRQPIPTPTPTLPPGTTPTNTPTPVVETPTNTPDPEDPTATPTPIDEVEGEITPGASPSPDAAATPIPPDSGSGTFAGSGSNMMAVLLALLMITSGAAVLALGRRETARN